MLYNTISCVEVLEDIMQNGKRDNETLDNNKRINQFGDYNNERMTQENWLKRWIAGQTRFHMPEIHP